MILVDTSVWIEHLRRGDVGLDRALNEGRVLCHPLVIGELAVGNLKNRDLFLTDLRDLPPAVVATDSEVLTFIDVLPLHGLGIGYTDAHLLASVLLTPDAKLWTLDRRLREVAENRLHLSIV